MNDDIDEQMASRAAQSGSRGPAVSNDERVALAAPERRPWGDAYLRVTLKADVNGWDVDECEGRSHRELFRVYAEKLRQDAARYQRDADRLRSLAEYVDRLALVEEP